MYSIKTGQRPVAIVDICLVLTADICPLSAADICPVSTEDIYPISAADIRPGTRGILPGTRGLLVVKSGPRTPRWSLPNTRSGQDDGSSANSLK